MVREFIGTRLRKARLFYEEHERMITGAALLGGFILDNFTLQRIDLLFENIILITYLIIAGSAIVYINLYEARKPDGRLAGWLRLASPIAMQFAFGGLFSGFVIFYSRSASISTSWLFLLFLLALMIGNEIFAKKFSRLTFQIVIFFTALLSFSIFYVPIIVSEIGPLVFLLSCLVSLFVIYLFMRLIKRINRVGYDLSEKRSKLSILAVLSVVIIFYFTNIIPPIPLSLIDATVGYNITRTTEGDYEIMTKDESFFESLLGDTFGRRTVEVTGNTSLYFFSSVFAPTDLETQIVHEWQVRENDNWKTVSRVPYPIQGGRGAGYRGYSIKQNIYPGKWRVNIETARGQTIGRLVFHIENTSTLPETETIIY